MCNIHLELAPERGIISRINILLVLSISKKGAGPFIPYNTSVYLKITIKNSVCLM